MGEGARNGLLAAVFAALLGTPSTAAETVVIGSKNFTENRILAHVMGQLIEERLDVEVRLEDGLGGTLFVFDALRAGEIDLYPEYTGTGWAVVLGESDRASDPLATYIHVAREYARRFDIHWLAPFGFSNSYALAARTDVAERLGLRRVSDLLPHAHTLSAGVSHEFLERDDGWPGVSTTYGLQIDDLRGMEHGLAFAAIDEGEIDLIDAWTTDGKLLRFDVTVLEDDLGFWPPYHCAPVVRAETLTRVAGLEQVLAELALRLPDRRMQQLNHAVELEGMPFRAVARRFLQEEGLLAAAANVPTDTAAGDRRGDLLGFVSAQTPRVLGLAVEHLLMALGAVLAATLLAVPMGIVCAHRPSLGRVVLGATGVIQTVPTLALLAFMLPLLGLGLDAALTALFLYALLPILRNTHTGIREVDPALVEAARGMGLTSGQLLRHVVLPLATPTLVAGVRTAAVISIGVATLAAFIGAGGLGEPIITGLQLNDMRLVLSGAVPAALLALLVDLGFEHWERRLARRRGLA